MIKTIIFLLIFSLNSSVFALISGSIISSKGNIFILRKGNKVKAAAGTGINKGDIIITGENSLCEVAMLDGSKININENTSFKLKDFSLDGFKRKTQIGLDEGTIRSLVEKFDPDKSEFTVETPTAVAGVRGTDFITQSHGKKFTEISVISGKVAIRDKIHNNHTMIRPGQRLRVAQHINKPNIQKFSPKKLNIQKPGIKNNMPIGKGKGPKPMNANLPPSVKKKMDFKNKLDNKMNKMPKNPKPKLQRPQKGMMPMRPSKPMFQALPAKILPPPDNYVK